MLFMYLFEMYLLHQLQNNLHEGLFFSKQTSIQVSACLYRASRTGENTIQRFVKGAEYSKMSYHHNIT